MLGSNPAKHLSKYKFTRSLIKVVAQIVIQLPWPIPVLFNRSFYLFMLL